MQNVPGVLSVASAALPREAGVLRLQRRQSRSGPRCRATRKSLANCDQHGARGHAASGTPAARCCRCICTSPTTRRRRSRRVIGAVKAFRARAPERAGEDPAGQRQRRRAGGDQRGARSHRAADDALRLRCHRGAGLPHLPRLARDDRLLPAADRGDVHRLLVHEGAGDRPHGRHPAGDGAGRRHRRRLRLLHLQPAADPPGRGRRHRHGVRAGDARDRHRDRSSPPSRCRWAWPPGRSRSSSSRPTWASCWRSCSWSTC